MKLFRSILFASVASLLLACDRAQSTPISYSYTGTVMSVDGPISIPNPPTVGNPVAGFFSFDDEAVAELIDGSLASRNEDFVGYRQSPPGGLEVFLPGLSASTDGASLATVINDDFGNGLRSYSFAISDGFLPSLSGETIQIDGAATQGVIGIGFDEFPSSQPLGFELPTELESISDAVGSIEYTLPNLNFRTRITFSIDTLTAAPEPAMMWLIGIVVLTSWTAPPRRTSA